MWIVRRQLLEGMEIGNAPIRRWATAHQHFRLRVFTFNAEHIVAALRFCVNTGHFSKVTVSSEMPADS